MKPIEFNGKDFTYNQSNSKEEILEEYIDFLKELDDKFDFYDLEKFNDEFYNFLEEIKKIKDIEKIQELFFILLYKHAQKRDFDEQFLSAMKEIVKE